MLDRLENDRSLARFAGQFVPLKLVTSNNPEWARWARLYPVEGNGIPRLYVIRADGEKLYGGVGSLSGDKLPMMMLASLRQAGRSFSEAEAANLENAVTRARSMLDDGDLLSAAVALSAVTAFGSPDALQSFAKPARDASESYERLVAELQASAEKARENLSSSSEPSSEPLDELIALYEAEVAFKQFPKLKSKAIAWTREIQQQTSYKQTADQAENLVKARALAASLNPRQKNRAPAAYTSVIRRFPETKVAEIARAELVEIDPDAKILQAESVTSDSDSSTPMKGLRTWTSSDGQFTTVARFLKRRDGKVQLEKKDGTTIVVDISVLSESDQAFIISQP